MLLLVDNGVNNVVFSADHIINDWGPAGSTQPNNSLFLHLTNDMTRESVGVELLKLQANGDSAIHKVGSKLHGTFLAQQSGTSALSLITLSERGYYSYKLYENQTGGVYPPQSVYNSPGSNPNTKGPFVYKEIDRGKALVLSSAQYTAIINGTTTAGKTTRDLPDGEVSYTAHTNKITSSQIDATNNFIHIN